MPREEGKKYSSAKSRQAVKHPDSKSVREMVQGAHAGGNPLTKHYEEALDAEGKKVKRVTIPKKGKRRFGVVLELTGDGAEKTSREQMEAGLEIMLRTLNTIPPGEE